MVLMAFRHLSAGCAGVASICFALPQSAHRIIKIIRISSVFADRNPLLICGLWVRFPPGSPRLAVLGVVAPGPSSATRLRPSASPTWTIPTRLTTDFKELDVV